MDEWDPLKRLAHGAEDIIPEEIEAFQNTEQIEIYKPAY